MISGEQVEMRPIAAADVPELRRIHLTPEVSAFWGTLEDHFPDDDPEATRFTIWHEDRVAGLVQFGEENEPDYRHAWIDIYVDPALHGRGVGTDAVRAVLRHLIDVRGHHRVVIDPALENGPAIRSYIKVGFKPVGVCHAGWRNPAGEWRDELMMEYVELPAG